LFQFLNQAPIGSKSVVIVLGQDDDRPVRGQAGPCVFEDLGGWVGLVKNIQGPAWPHAFCHGAAPIIPEIADRRLSAPKKRSDLAESAMRGAWRRSNLTESSRTSKGGAAIAGEADEIASKSAISCNDFVGLPR